LVETPVLLMLFSERSSQLAQLRELVLESRPVSLRVLILHLSTAL